MDFTFIHAADLHLDSPLSATSRADDALRPVLENATFKSFERVVTLCVEERVAFLLLAGDLFNRRDRSVRARLFLREQLTRLEKADIRVFIVHGNHDPMSGDSGTLILPKNVKVFGAKWEEVEVKRGGELLCRVQGMSYPTERVETNLSRHFSRQGPELTIGLLHANVGGYSAHANYSPASWDDLSETGIDYWALGHVHTRTEKALRSGGLGIYPGNPQGRHAFEPGPRGCIRVRVTGKTCTPDFVPVDSVRWHLVRVSTAGISDLGTLEQEVEARVSEACEGRVDAHAIRIVLEGRSALHSDLAKPEDKEAFEGRLRELLRQKGTPVLLELLVDETQPLVDFDALRAEQGLCATLFEEAERAELSELWSRGGLKGLDETLQKLGMRTLAEEGQSLVNIASRRAIELLVEEPR